jgi:hypothetical protein
MRRTGFLVVLLATLSAAGVRAEAPMPRFPAIVAENLARDRVSLPAGLAGTYNLVVVAYRREQQADVDTWMPALGVIEKDDPRFRWYELPTIGKLTGVFVSPWLDDAMRAGIPDQAQRARTITLYVDKQWFRESLGLPDSDGSIHLLLLDRQGRVLWRRDGAYDSGAAAELKSKLKALR